MNSTELYPAIDRFAAGQAAMTAVAASRVPQLQSVLGDQLGLMVFPKFGSGKMAGRPIIDMAGFGISSQSANKQLAAQLLTYLVFPDQLTDLFKATHAMPAGNKWDTGVIDNPLLKDLYTRWVRGPGVPYISNLMPTVFWTDAMFVNSQNIIAGQSTGEQAGLLATKVAHDWCDQNSALVDRYDQWAADLVF